MSVAPPEDILPRIKTAVVQLGGGYLRNLSTTLTCTWCHTPLGADRMCGKCQFLTTAFEGGPDRVGFMTYGGHIDPIFQSGHTMHRYKDQPADRDAWAVVTLLTALGLRGHIGCAGRLAGEGVSAWASVPTLPFRPGQHPLNIIVAGMQRDGAVEVPLTAASTVFDARAANVNHFTAGPQAHGRHVILVDDTWTGGGHTTSAALALRAAGASHVSVLVVARWLSVGWEATTTAWAKETFSGADFDPEVCPWTQGACPP